MSLRTRSMVGWLIVVLLALTYLATRLRVDSDFSAFLPSGLTDTQRIFIQQLQDGVASRLLLVELKSDEPEHLAAISQSLAARLAADPTFRYVNNGGGDAGQRELALIERYRYVLSDGVIAERFTPAGLRAALEERLEGLAGSAGALEKRLLAADPTGEVLRVLLTATPGKSPRRMQGVWFNGAGDGALLLAETRAAGSDLAGQENALATLRRGFDEARGGSAAQIRYSSPGAMAVESRALIASDATRLSLLSTLLVLAILAWFYRSLPVVLLCTLPAASGLLVGIAAVNLWFGSVHAIALGFGVTLLGEAVDYPSYLLTQVDRGETASAALKRILPVLCLAVLTTACGSLGLLMASFPGLAQLGLMTVVGVVTAGIVTCLLPQWLPANWAGVATSRRFAIAVRAPPTSRLRQGIVVATIAAMLVLTSQRPWWDDDLANMNPLPHAFKEQDRTMRAALGASDVRSLLVVAGASQEQVLRIGERLRGNLAQWVSSGDIGGFDLVSDYLPSERTQALRQAALPPPDQLRANLAEAAAGLPFRPDTFAPFLNAVEDARQARRLTAEALAGTGFGLKAGSLLRHDGDRWTMVVPLTAVTNPDALAAKTVALRLPGVQWIDLRAESVAMMSAYRRQALLYAALGSVLIYVVLAQGLRSPRRAWRVTMPIGVALILTAATLVAAGQPISVFHLVALLLVLGIGINYALFFVRATEMGDEFSRTLQTLAVVSGTTLCAFGMLALSSTPVLHAIGLTVSLGVVFSLLASMLLVGAPANASDRKQ